VEKFEGKVDMHETDIRLLVEDVRGLKRKGASADNESRKIGGFSKE